MGFGGQYDANKEPKPHAKESGFFAALRVTRTAGDEPSRYDGIRYGSGKPDP